MLWWLLFAAIILLPRYYLWGMVPAGVHGDEGGFAAVGMQMFANPPPLYTFGPQSLPNAHFWLYGAGIEALGRSIWSARFVTSIFGVLQAFAVVDIARRTAGTWAALTAALAMAIPLQLHFDRLAMCNVITTATWAGALWFVVRFPRRPWAAFVAGALLALGWYGYQSSRIAPVIAAAGLLPLLARAPTRRTTMRLIAVGLAGFVTAIAPLAYGFYLYPPNFAGRAQATSWLQEASDLSALRSHLSATGWALLGLQWDESRGFFSFDIPVVPIGMIGLSLLGWLACPAASVRRCLAAWIILVLVGNVVRNTSVYSPVLICMVPALALTAAYSARWLGVVAPLALALMIARPIYAYFQEGARVPSSEVLPMAQADFIRRLDGEESVLIAGGVGCGHGMTAFALHGRPCRGPETIGGRSHPPEVFIVFPEFDVLNKVLAKRADLIENTRQWGQTPVRIWSSRPLPEESSSLQANTLQ